MPTEKKSLHNMVDAIIADDSAAAAENFHSYVTDKVKEIINPEVAQGKTRPPAEKTTSKKTK